MPNTKVFKVNNGSDKLSQVKEKLAELETDNWTVLSVQFVSPASFNPSDAFITAQR